MEITQSAAVANTEPRRIPLRDRYGAFVAHAIVDAEDYDRIAQWRWYRKESMPGYFIAVRNTPRSERGRGRPVQIRMHREVLDLPPGKKPEVDHISRDTLDNRKSNLRICTHAQNRQNTKGWDNATSKYRGVSWDKSRGKWKVQIRIDGKNTCVGRYDDEEVANEASIAARAKHYPFSED